MYIREERAIKMGKWSKLVKRFTSDIIQQMLLQKYVSLSCPYRVLIY